MTALTVTPQGTAARTGPAIPGLEQGNPAVSNRPVQTPAGQAQTQTGQPAQPQTPQQIRDQLRDQIRQSVQNGGTPQINIPNDFTNMVPRGAVDIATGFFVMVAFIIVGLPLARAFARRMDARSQALASGATTLGPQIQQLQESVDGMAVELERITEAQRFQSKLLAGREKEPERLAR